jgi:hypothetical protein
MTDNDRSRLGLDEEHGLLRKLGLFVAVLLIGPLIGLLCLAAMGNPMMSPVWRRIGHYAIETLAVFWGCLLVFIWWRPPWFRKIYLSIERKVVLIVTLLVAVGTLALILDVTVGWQRIANLF